MLKIRIETEADDRRLMGRALREARAAAAAGEVPVGAIVVLEGRIVGRGHNRPIGSDDPTAHAEIVALREAALRVGNYRLTGALLVVTLEPCLMCLGAALHARVAEVCFGASDPRLGAASLLGEMQSRPGSMNHRLELRGGVREEECSSLLRGFFTERRSAAPERGARTRPEAHGARARLAGSESHACLVGTQTHACLVGAVS